MLKIRLQRIGRKNDPRFRVVVVDSHQGPKSGNFVENLGSHDPRRDTSEIKADRVHHWMAQGAKVSDTLHNLFVSKKIIEGKKVNVLPRKSPIKKEGEVGEAPTPETPVPVAENAGTPAPEQAPVPAETQAEGETTAETKAS